MFRKIFAAVLIVTAITAASAAVPGLFENVELACVDNNPACRNVEPAPVIELACDKGSGINCNVQPVPAIELACDSSGAGCNVQPATVIELACNPSTGQGCGAVQIFRGGIA